MYSHRATQKVSKICAIISNSVSGFVFCSDVVSVASFGVRVSVMFQLCFFIILLVWFRLLSGRLLGNTCPLG